MAYAMGGPCLASKGARLALAVKPSRQRRTLAGFYRLPEPAHAPHFLAFVELCR
jgi:hypothetical protein